MSGVLHGLTAPNQRRSTAISVNNTHAGTTLSSGVTSVTFSGAPAITGHLLLALGGTQSITEPTFTDGWTKVCSFSSTGSLQRTGIIVYKYATSQTEVVTFTGSGSSAVNYSAGVSFRNVSGIGNTATYLDNTSGLSTINSPSLTLRRTDGSSALFLSWYAATITAAPNGLTVTNGVAYGTGYSSWAGGTFTVSGSGTGISGIVELLN